jgi:hypothetical protein
MIQVGLGREHHGHIDVSGHVGEPFGVARVRKSGEVKRVFVGWGGDDGVDFPAESELCCGFDGMPGDAAGANRSIPVVNRLTAPHTPGAHPDFSLRLHHGDLVFGPYDGNFGGDGGGQCCGGDLGADTPGVAQSDGEPRT